MTVKCGDITDLLDSIAPPGLAEKWDNVGLLCGNRNWDVKSLLVSLDISNGVIEKIHKYGYDMVIAHHPPIFEKADRILDGDINTEMLIPFLKKDVCVYAAHTNLDSAVSGVAAKMAEKTGLTDIKDLGDHGFCKVGYLPHRLSQAEFEKLVMNVFGTDHLRIIGRNDGMISRIAVYPGSLGDGIDDILRISPDAVVTGEVKYHNALVLLRRSVFTVEAGHYNTERIILPYIADRIKRAFTDLRVDIHEDREPYDHRIKVSNPASG